MGNKIYYEIKKSENIKGQLRLRAFVSKLNLPISFLAIAYLVYFENRS